ALAVGEILNISRVVDTLQETDLQNQGGYFPEVVEDALDKLTMMIQQVESGDGDGGGGGGSTPVVVTNPRIAVLGASETVFPWTETWVDHARKAFAAEGIGIDIFHTGAGAITHRIALDTPDTLTGQTRVQLTNAVSADIIIVELGINDAILEVGGRTRQEMIDDAEELYANLRAANSGAVICYSPITPYDVERHGGLPTSSIKKKYCVPYLHGYSTKTGETTSWTSEYGELNEELSSASQTLLDDWKALDASIRNLTEVDVVIETNYFRPARLGLTSHDRVHPNSQGHWFILSRIWNAFQTNATIRAAIPAIQQLRNLGDFTNMDLTWDSAVKLDAGGDGYDIDPDWLDGFEYPMWINVFGNTGLIPHAAYWGNQQRPSIEVNDQINRSIGQFFTVNMNGLWPGAEIQTKMWLATNPEPTTWNSNTPEPKYSSNTGTHLGIDQPSLASGDYLIKYKVGKDIFGPFSVTLSGAYSSGSGTVDALFVRETNLVTLTSQWDRVELDSVDYNDDPTNIQFNASTGEVVIPASSGYSRMRISGFFTNDSNADGVYAIGFQRNGVAQHNRMVGNTAIDSTAGAAFPLQSFTSPWLPINAGGESLFLQLFNPTSTQLQGVYAMGLGIELKQ
ncbi:MAG: SGNH/GDSL hydrolase family protein, partial [Candidatus Thiodiazotropha endolucinida]